VTSPTPFRRRVELTAGPMLVMLARLPRVVPFLVVLGLLVGGLLLSGPVGAALLALLALLLGLLLFLAWPALPQQARLVRLAVVLLVLFSAVRAL
jgi:hypothetical protein